MTHVCPSCCEHELVSHPALEGWLHCPGCSRAVLAADLVDLAERLAEKGDELAREILECWREQVCREVPGGGGDDGHCFVPDRPPGDERVVRELISRGRGRNFPLRVTQLECSSNEMRAALAAWLRALPAPEEVQALMSFLKEIRRRR